MASVMTDDKMHRSHDNATIPCSMASFDQSFGPFLCSPVSLHLNGVSESMPAGRKAGDV